MEWKTFQDKVFKLASRKGFEEAELYYARGGEFQLSSLKGEIENYNDATFSGVYFKGLKSGKIGASYAETLSGETAEMLVNEAFENYSIASGGDVYYLYDGSGEYPEFDGYTGEFRTQPVQEKIDKVLALERNALEYDRRIIMAPNCSIADTWMEVFIVNTLGLDKHYRADGGYAVIVSLAGENGDKKTGFSFALARTPQELDVEALGMSASKKAIDQLGAGKIKSGKYKVLFKNDVFGQLFGTFMGMYSAENVQKGLSLLAGREGEKIASDKLTVYDDPLLSISPNSRPFDDEGVPCQKKAIIENGTLKTFLYDLKTAAKAGVQSTGNAIKGSYRSKPTIAPVNTVIEAGRKSYAELVEALGEGIIVTSLSGLHSGANPISGEFSLGANGFQVKNGKVHTPLEQFTISSNILNIYGGIVEIGSDSVSSIYRVTSPSVLAQEIDVASDNL